MHWAGEKQKDIQEENPLKRLIILEALPSWPILKL